MDQTGERELMMNAITDAADLSLMYLARYREAADRWMKETPPVLHRNRETAIREFSGRVFRQKERKLQVFAASAIFLLGV